MRSWSSLCQAAPVRSGHLQLHMFQRSGLWTQPIQTTEVQCIEMAAGVSELASEAAGWYKI